jgi:predicted lipoprotein with Yx(FWY)xxD motif
MAHLFAVALATVVAAVPVPSAQAREPTGKVIHARSSNYGRVLFDGAGRVAYAFTKETGATPQCYGECAKAWPPVLTKGHPRARRGAAQGKLGTTRRTDGRTQVTYDGHPLYYWYGDGPGQIGCQNASEFGGLWLIERPDGSLVR